MLSKDGYIAVCTERYLDLERLLSSIFILSTSLYPQVEYEDSSELYPKLQYRPLAAPVAQCNSLVGVKESARTIAGHLTKMCLDARVVSEEEITVTIPPTRQVIAVAHSFAFVFNLRN